MSSRLPGGVVALGFVSLFMDVSSEMIHALLPLFLTGTLGAPVLYVGLIEGAGEGLAQIVKVFSGALSDRIGRRKPLLLFGYGLAGLTKPAFALAGSAGMVLAARLADRLGKGIRGAPRDALVADLVPPERRGAAFGLRQTLDTIGAVIGPLLAIGILWASSGNIRLVFALAIIPAAIALLILARGVQEPPRAAPAPAGPGPRRFSREAMAALGRPFWMLTALAALIAVARLSEPFLILRASDAGLGLTWTPLVLSILSATYAATAWPVGHLSDRLGGRGLLALSLAVLAAAYACLIAGGLPLALAGVALWGLHMGLSQGVLTAALSRLLPASLRGTGFGLYNLAGGLATLAANGLAGGLWTLWGPGAAFGLGAGAALLALALTLSRPALWGAAPK